VDAAYFQQEVAPRLPGAHWIGEVGVEQKVRLLGDAVALLFPVDWEEPFGLVMIEAMFCGTPVIAFPRGAVQEVVDEGVTGFVVPDVEAMAERLAWLASPRASFDRDRCRQVAIDRFGAARMVDRYLDVYRAAVGGRARVRVAT
jgi:glycosyltransferase involved in cell wall biosynthesis